MTSFGPGDDVSTRQRDVAWVLAYSEIAEFDVE